MEFNKQGKINNQKRTTIEDKEVKCTDYMRFLGINFDNQVNIQKTGGKDTRQNKQDY